MRVGLARSKPSQPNLIRIASGVFLNDQASQSLSSLVVQFAGSPKEWSGLILANWKVIGVFGDINNGEKRCELNLQSDGVTVLLFVVCTDAQCCEATWVRFPT